MSPEVTNRLLPFLRASFLICETAFIGSFVALGVGSRFYPRLGPKPGWLVLFSIYVIYFFSLLLVCFFLRRGARTLAVIGFWTAFIVFGYGLLTPQL